MTRTSRRVNLGLRVHPCCRQGRSPWAPARLGALAMLVHSSSVPTAICALSANMFSASRQTSESMSLLFTRNSAHSNVSFATSASARKVSIRVLFSFFSTNTRELGNLRKHTNSVHLNSRPFACPTCGSSFGFKDGLTRHIKLVHENARPFKCDRCGASYKQISQLRRHAAVCSTAGGSSRK